MSEFKIEGEALKREARFRVLSWGTVLLLLGATVLLFVLGVSGYLSAYWSLRLLFVFTLLGTVIGTCVLACREALHYAERQMIFVLDGDEVVRKRRGYPEVRIPFSEIDTLSEELGWLIIKSAEPRRRIAIPNSVSGYGVIRAELAKHHPLSARVAFPLKSTALLVVAFLSWGAVLWLRDMRGIITAGIVAVVTLAFGSYRLWSLLHRSSKRALLWASLCFTWLVAFLLIYLRVARP
jgi:hypothetical protein